ncbi:hypothetical protein [Streptomyces sp. NPDC001222]
MRRTVRAAAGAIGATALPSGCAAVDLPSAAVGPGADGAPNAVP